VFAIAGEFLISTSTTLTVDTIALREGRAVAVVDVGSFDGPPSAGQRERSSGS